MTEIPAAPQLTAQHPALGALRTVRRTGPGRWLWTTVDPVATRFGEVIVTFESDETGLTASQSSLWESIARSGVDWGAGAGWDVLKHWLPAPLPEDRWSAIRWLRAHLPLRGFESEWTLTVHPAGHPDRLLTLVYWDGMPAFVQEGERDPPP